jgi:hypothetical protein
MNHTRLIIKSGAPLAASVATASYAGEAHEHGLFGFFHLSGCMELIMQSKREQISTKQLMFSVGCFIQGSTLLTYGIHKLAKQGAWIAIIIGYVISLPICGCIFTWQNASQAKA